MKIWRISRKLFFDFNLAFADLMKTIGISILAFNIYNWRLRKFFCSFLFDLFIKVSYTASCFILVLISYTRYCVITHPFIKAESTKKQCSKKFWTFKFTWRFWQKAFNSEVSRNSQHMNFCNKMLMSAKFKKLFFSKWFY